LFGVTDPEDQGGKIDLEILESGGVRGFQNFRAEQNPEGDFAVVTLAATVNSRIFLRVLEFWYTGITTISGKTDFVTETKELADLFECGDLSTICENVVNGTSELNPSIGTWLNDKFGEKANALFLNKPLFSDVKFRAGPQGTLVYGHRALMTCHCPVLQAMLTGGFKEGREQAVDIKDTTREVFLAFVEYLYSAHAPIEDSDSVSILELANQFGMPRLVNLCELYISKEVERATTNGIEKADIDVIGLLLTAQRHNADQLAQFCLHFISTNFQPMKKRPEFSLLGPENTAYVEEHQWPPVSYLKAVEEYEKLTGKGTNCIIM